MNFLINFLISSRNTTFLHCEEVIQIWVPGGKGGKREADFTLTFKKITMHVKLRNCLTKSTCVLLNKEFTKRCLNILFLKKKLVKIICRIKSHNSN